MAANIRPQAVAKAFDRPPMWYARAAAVGRHIVDSTKISLCSYGFSQLRKCEGSMADIFVD
jgi:hypothetical protein